MRFQLQGTQALAKFPAHAARVRLENPRHLHGQGGSAGDDATVADHLRDSAQRGKGINAGMLPEPAILIGQQGFEVVGRHFVHGHRIAPDALRIGEGAQRRSVARDDHRAAAVRVWQGQGTGPAEYQCRDQDQAEQGAGKVPSWPASRSARLLRRGNGNRQVAGLPEGPRCAALVLHVIPASATAYGLTTSTEFTVLRPMPRISGRYMSSTSGGGTRYVPGETARTR